MERYIFHIGHIIYTCRQISNTTRTKFQNINVSRLVLQLYLHNYLKLGVKSSM